MSRFLVVYVLLFTTALTGFGQDSLLVKSLEANRTEFEYSEGAGFKGYGWDTIVSAARANQYFLIGEVHGINELPLFMDQLTRQVRFQTFVAEIDPFLSEIMQTKIRNLPEAELQKWYQQMGPNLSFYSFRKDFQLLKTFHERGISLIGIEQITLLNDIPVYVYLSELTTDKGRKAQYLKMARDSEAMLAAFLKDQKQPLYLTSPQVKEELDNLRKQTLAAREREVLDMLEYSWKIYTMRDSHQRRIKLMKSLLMAQYEESLRGKKALFRLGANHSPKGESLLTVYDVGNLAHNLAESQLSSSYHIAIFARSGEAGTPFKGMPAMKVEQLKELDPFYTMASADKWTYYNLKPLKRLVETGKLTIANERLKRIIKGYDGLLMVPNSTAGEHVN